MEDGMQTENKASDVITTMQLLDLATEVLMGVVTN